jgi:drug/metabolite transporter (DMT)-like permease
MKAVFFMNLLQLCFTFISTMFKQLNREGVSAVELMLWRNAWDFFLVQFWLWPQKRNPFDKKELKGQQKWVYVRCFFGQLSFLLYYYSVTLLPISFHVIIIQLSPLFTSLLSYFLNGERVEWFEYLAMGLAFSGVCAIATGKQGGSDRETEWFGVSVSLSACIFLSAC